MQQYMKLRAVYIIGTNYQHRDATRQPVPDLCINIKRRVPTVEIQLCWSFSASFLACIARPPSSTASARGTALYLLTGALASTEESIKTSLPPFDFDNQSCLKPNLV